MIVFYLKIHERQEEEAKICAKSSGVGNEMKQHIKSKLRTIALFDYSAEYFFAVFKYKNLFIQTNISRDLCHVWLMLDAERILLIQNCEVD